jgi:hypothetical protein
MLKLVILALLAGPMFGQNGQMVNQVSGSPPNSVVQQLQYSGSTLEAVCYGPALNPLTTFYKSSSTLTNIAVSTGTATITFSSTSYLWQGAQITVAGSATTALNGSYRVTAVSGSTATFTTAAVDGTYTDAGLTVSTTAPLLNAKVWAIQILVYSGANLINTYWAGVPSVTPANGLICSNWASY